jgi:hypothetical protein
LISSSFASSTAMADTSSRVRAIAARACSMVSMLSGARLSIASPAHHCEKPRGWLQANATWAANGSMSSASRLSMKAPAPAKCVSPMPRM